MDTKYKSKQSKPQTEKVPHGTGHGFGQAGDELTDWLFMAGMGLLIGLLLNWRWL